MIRLFFMFSLHISECLISQITLVVNLNWKRKLYQQTYAGTKAQSIEEFN